MKRLKVRRWHGYLFVIIVVTMALLGFFNMGAVKNQHKNSPINIVKTPVAEAQKQVITTPNTSNDQQTSEKMQQPSEKSQTVSAALEMPIPNDIPKIYYKSKVAVLTYHHLDATESSVTITPERFKSHLNVLKSNGFNVISVEDFIAFLQKKKTVPPNAVVITFDDGYESVYKYAYPVLKSEGMVATVFLIVSYVDDGTLRQPSILNWKQITEMHNDGFSFYSHSYNSHGSMFNQGKESSLLATKTLIPSTHRIETDEEYMTRVRDDLTKADDILNAKLANKINLLCLPHGQYNNTLIDIAKQSQISYLFTGIEGLNTDKVKLITRINAGSPYMSEKLLIKKLSSNK